ncbi:WD repeat-containing protein 86 [Caerostris extrusa]|uniref:WD repeat-containing protein 86 n=1 Tax=Caerostris extrusa TaxID=172846 RepID=A0AAV4RSL3_CAEEX|nr:WD repeat-containing protein 86 [Caerostris extrusa]
MGCQPSTDSGAKKPKKQPHLLQEIKDHKSGINCMVLSDDGSMLVTGVRRQDGPHVEYSLRPHGMFGGARRTRRSFMDYLSKEDNIIRSKYDHLCGYITCCAVHEQCVITGSSDSSIRKWFIATAECQAIYVGHSSRISRLLCVGQLIFSTSSDHTIRAWLFDLREISDDQGEACIKVFQGHSKGTYPLLHVPMDENAGLDLGAGVLVSGSADCTARSWSVDSGLCLKVILQVDISKTIFRGHTAPLNCLAYDDQKQTLYTAGGDGLIKSWNLMSGEALKVLRGHEGPVFCILVSKLG